MKTPETIKLIIVSDIHFAGAAEKARGDEQAFDPIKNPLMRMIAHLYRHYIWMRHPLERGALLTPFLAEAGPADLVVVNGDHSRNSAFIGLGDPAALASATECLDRIKAVYDNRAHFVFGDHELGKVVMFTGSGGMRLASWHACVDKLDLKPFWELTVGNYVLIAVCSPLLALPANKADTLPEEWPEWQRLREAHLAEIRGAFSALRAGQRVLLFCHDPTALPFLAAEETVQRRLPQLEHTIIGHLHSNLIIWQSRLLSWVPPITFLGHTVKKMSATLSKSRAWRPFKIKLCPALGGIQLLNDGGYFTVTLDATGKKPAEFVFHPVKRP